MDEAEVVERVALVADHQPAEVAEPSEEPLNLPAPPIAPQGPAILGLGALPTASMWRNHFNAEFQERLVQGVSVVGAVADDSLGQLVDEAGVEGGRDESDLVRRI